MTAAIVYGGLLFAIGGAYVIGRSLDKTQSNSQVTWKTGCIGMKTVIQSVVLGLVGGPIVYFLKGGKDELLLCILAMMAAPFVVDLLRPTVQINSNTEQVSPQFASRLNVANIIAIAVCACVIGVFVGWHVLRGL